MLQESSKPNAKVERDLRKGVCEVLLCLGAASGGPFGWPHSGLAAAGTIHWKSKALGLWSLGPHHSYKSEGSGWLGRTDGKDKV